MTQGGRKKAKGVGKGENIFEEVLKKKEEVEQAWHI